MYLYIFRKQRRCAEEHRDAANRVTPSNPARRTCAMFKGISQLMDHLRKIMCKPATTCYKRLLAIFFECLFGHFSLLALRIWPKIPVLFVSYN